MEAESDEQLLPLLVPHGTPAILSHEPAPKVGPVERQLRSFGAKQHVARGCLGLIGPDYNP